MGGSRWCCDRASREGPAVGLSSAPARQHGAGATGPSHGRPQAVTPPRTALRHAVTGPTVKNTGWLEAGTEVRVVWQSKGKLGSRLSAMHLLKCPGCFLWGNPYQYCNF